MKKIKLTLALLLILSVVFVSFHQIEVKSEPKTIVVPDDYAAIQEAVDATSDGDTVFVKNDVYSARIHSVKLGLF